jgi:hypothetical protein
MTTPTLTPSEALAKLDRWATSTALLGYDFDRAYSLAEIRDALSAVVAENERLTKFREYVVGYFTETDDEAVLCRLDSLWHEVGPEGRQAINVMNERHAGLLSENESLRAERAADALDRLLKCAANASPYLSSDSQAAIKFALATLRAPAGEPVDRERVAQLIAHRACCGTEHDPLNGKLHGYCVVCGVDWPCEYAGKPPTTPPVVSSPPSEAPKEWDGLSKHGDFIDCGINREDYPSPAEQGARESVKEIVSDNWYIANRVMITSGEFWRCKHGITKFVEAGCPECKADLAPLAAGRVGVAEQTMTHVRKLMDEIHAENDDPYITHRLDQIASLLAGPVVAGECIWSQQDSGGDWVSTACGNEFVLNDASQYPDGGQVFPHCPYCAKPTTFRRWSLVYADTAKGNGNG